MIGRFLFAMSAGLFIFSPYATKANAQVPRELTLGEVLQFAERASPDLKASSQQELQANFSVTIARSNLLPKIDLSAVDSWGFPGSSAPVPPQFGGLLTSPFRKGVSGGLLGRITLFDLGDWRGLEQARETALAATEQSRIIRIRVDQAAVDLYFEATRYRGETEAWKGIIEKLEPILTTVKKFVKNGQASDVQRLLLEDQLREAQMKQAVADDHYRMTLKRLAILVDLDDTGISCPSAVTLDRSILTKLSEGKMSPLLSYAEAQVRAAKTGVSRSSAQYLPKIYAVGSAGLMEDSRLVDRQNVSAWVGLTLPLFEGFRISSKVGQAQAVADEREYALLAARLTVDDLNIRFDDTIRAANTQITFLTSQHILAVEAFNLARKRYLAFLEPVLNLKEAVKDLVRIEIQLSESKASLFRAEANKRIFNGATLPR